ncbi:amino acid ABC transporter permease [Pelagibacterium montanilacus]|uniref:amino acid ABC transporter permease n=1 Tax=Pelagibacterium montanilacus TaxID=2185280 RepID=UPI000F8C9C2C|nr:ABC transporter permease subunit [Pelagibacterium montanilacus]
MAAPTDNRPTSSAGSNIDSSLFYNPTARGIFYQGLLVALVALAAWWLQSNVSTNLAAQNKTLGLDFLSQTAGFNISFGLLEFARTSTYLDVYLIGILNTLLVAVVGIVLATLLGFIVGIARLSSNFLIRKLAMVYVEIIRNVPLLLQLLFWYFLALNAVPGIRESIEGPFGIVLNQRGLYLPALETDQRILFAIAALVVAIFLAVIWRRWRIKSMEEAGRRKPVLLPMLAIMIVPVVAVALIVQLPVAFSVPELTGFNYTGGVVVPPELTALVVGLVVYTSSFIAEIVRAGIQAVNYGQVEAAAALGLRDNDRLRLVVIPQALRIIVPPLTSQYLNLTKNSSLGAAIGFPELVNVFMGTALNQSGRAVEIVILTMAVYLTFSMVTSLFMNWYNSRVAMVER